MWESLMNMFSSNQSIGSDPGFASQTGTPDGVGPVMGGINQPMGDFTDDQLAGMARQQQNPYAMMGLQGQQAQAQQQPQSSIQSLMSMATPGSGQKPYANFMDVKGNPYLQSLMNRGL